MHSSSGTRPLISRERGPDSSSSQLLYFINPRWMKAKTLTSVRFELGTQWARRNAAKHFVQYANDSKSSHPLNEMNNNTS